MNDTGSRYDSMPKTSNTLGAVFATEHDALTAIKSLHKAGFRDTWFGRTRPSADGEPRVAVKGGLLNLLSAAGEETRSLHKALLERGISNEQTQRLERSIAPGCVIVTVYGEDNPSEASQLLAAAKGEVVEGTAPTAVVNASADPRTGVDKDERKERDRRVDEEERAIRGDGHDGGDRADSGRMTAGRERTAPTVRGSYRLGDDDDDIRGEEFYEYREDRSVR